MLFRSDRTNALSANEKSGLPHHIKLTSKMPPPLFDSCPFCHNTGAYSPALWLCPLVLGLLCHKTVPFSISSSLFAIETLEKRCFSSLRPLRPQKCLSAIVKSPPPFPAAPSCGKNSPQGLPCRLFPIPGVFSAALNAVSMPFEPCSVQRAGSPPGLPAILSINIGLSGLSRPENRPVRPFAYLMPLVVAALPFHHKARFLQPLMYLFQRRKVLLQIGRASCRERV